MARTAFLARVKIQISETKTEQATFEPLVDLWVKSAILRRDSPFFHYCWAALCGLGGI